MTHFGLSGRRAWSGRSTPPHFFDLARLPVFVEERLLRTIETQNYPPAFTRPCLHPVVFLADRRLGTEVDIHRSVGVHRNARFLAADAWELLIGLEHRACLVVVQHD